MTKVFVQGRYVNSVKEIKKLISTDHSLNWVNEDDISLADLVLYFDSLPKKNEKKLNLNKILIRQEPEIILPKNYKPGKLKDFAKVISVGASKYSTSGINWPQDFQSTDFQNSIRQQSKGVMVNSNLISLHKKELYSLRREVLCKSSEIDLYGKRWNITFTKKLILLFSEIKLMLRYPFSFKVKGMRYFFRNPKNCFGEIEDKFQIMTRYKFAIIIENSDNYVSEKLFDAFVSGCIPVYVGPPLENYDIPESLYIKAEPNFDSINRAVQIAKSINYATWSKSLNNWMSQPNTIYDWSKETFLKRLKVIIEL